MHGVSKTDPQVTYSLGIFETFLRIFKSGYIPLVQQINGIISRNSKLNECVVQSFHKILVTASVRRLKLDQLYSRYSCKEIRNNDKQPVL